MNNCGVVPRDVENFSSISQSQRSLIACDERMYPDRKLVRFRLSGLSNDQQQSCERYCQNQFFQRIIPPYVMNRYSNVLPLP